MLSYKLKVLFNVLTYTYTDDTYHYLSFSYCSSLGIEELNSVSSFRYGKGTDTILFSYDRKTFFSFF